MVEGTQFLKVGALHAVGLRVGSCFLSFIEALFDLLVEVEHTEAKIIPQLRVATKGIRCLFKVAEGLQELFLLE